MQQFDKATAMQSEQQAWFRRNTVSLARKGAGIEGTAFTHHGRRRRHRERAGDGGVTAAVWEEAAELERHGQQDEVGGRPLRRGEAWKSG